MKKFLNHPPDLAGRFSAGSVLLLFLLGFLVAVLVLSGDRATVNDRAKPEKVVYPGELLVFSAGTEKVLDGARPARTPPGLSVGEALNLLALHLENSYFFRTSEGDETGIWFAVENVYALGVKARPCRVAVIDMKDDSEVARRLFFQGSFGGQSTFFIISATFLQAQNDPPLLDGMILLYNGKPFPRMDHIDFSGIVTPAAVRRVVWQAVAASGDGKRH